MRIDEDKIFDVYMKSLIEEAKKTKKPDADKDGVPDWADKKPGKDDKESEGKGKKEQKGKKGKKGKIPAGLAAYLAKKKGKKTVKESVDDVNMNDRQMLENVLNKLAEATGEVTLTPEEVGIVYQYLSDGINDQLFNFPDDEENFSDDDFSGM